MEVYFSLGTNLGNKEENLRTALRLMDEAFGCHYSRLSSFMITEPWGFDCEDEFLNCAVVYQMDISPEEVTEKGLEILARCKEIEAAMGRDLEVLYDGEGKRIYRSRIIDIDILLIGECTISEPALKVPHQLMYERDFVMKPLNEILIKQV